MSEDFYMPEPVLTTRDTAMTEVDMVGHCCFSFLRSNGEDRQRKGNYKWYLDRVP